MQSNLEKFKGKDVGIFTYQIYKKSNIIMHCVFPEDYELIDFTDPGIECDYISITYASHDKLKEDFPIKHYNILAIDDKNKIDKNIDIIRFLGTSIHKESSGEINTIHFVLIKHFN